MARRIRCSAAGHVYHVLNRALVGHWHRHHATQVRWLTVGPLALPTDWNERLHRARTGAEQSALRRSVIRGAPFGVAPGQKQTAVSLGLESSLRQRARPRRATKQTEVNPTWSLLCSGKQHPMLENSLG